MGNEASTAKIDVRNLDQASVEKIRETFKGGPMKELPSTWNILPEETKRNLANLLKDQQGNVDERKYIEFAARHISISQDEHVRLLTTLMRKQPPFKISEVKSALIQLFTALHNSYKTQLSDEVLAAQTSSLADSLLHQNLFGSEKRKNTFGKVGDYDKEMDTEDLEKLINENQMIEYTIHHVLATCFNVKQKLVPKSKLPVKQSFLSPLQLFFLNSNLPLKFKDCWRPIFNTRQDGESFSKFAGLIINRGATVILIKDNEGNIFGGFNSQSWKIGPNFFGSSDSFLFHLHPVMNVYDSTPFNQNYQYFNMKQKTMPNGLGQGGQLEYFGYWVDSEFGRVVTSPSCTTYFSPQLGVKDGKIEDLEVWGLGPEPEDTEGGSGSVLNMDPELQAVMEMMGKTFHSKAIREVDAKEDEEQEEED